MLFRRGLTFHCRLFTNTRLQFMVWWFLVDVFDLLYRLKSLHTRSHFYTFLTLLNPYQLWQFFFFFLFVSFLFSFCCSCFKVITCVFLTSRYFTDYFLSLIRRISLSHLLFLLQIFYIYFKPFGRSLFFKLFLSPC